MIGIIVGIAIAIGIIIFAWQMSQGAEQVTQAVADFIRQLSGALAKFIIAMIPAAAITLILKQATKTKNTTQMLLYLLFSTLIIFWLINSGLIPLPF